MIILVQRSGALGDVVLTTPVVRRLARENPGARIIVQTGYPEIYAGSPYASARAYAVLPRHDRLVQLDLAYEKRPHVHIVRAYMIEAFGADKIGVPDDWQQEMFGVPGARAPYLPGKPVIVVHGSAGSGWRNQAQTPQFWADVHHLLRMAGYATISIGRIGDAGGGTIDVRSSAMNAIGLRNLIQRAVCYVGSDSGPLHIAGTTDVPIVGLYTCARPELRLPWRGGEQGGGCIGLQPDLPCVGCLHDEAPPVTSVGCRRGDFACVENPAHAIKPAKVLEAVLKLLEKNR